MTSSKTILSVDDLRKWYPTRSNSFLGLFGEKDYLKAVDDVSFRIKKGEIIGLAGQSGCGKSTLGELLVGLQNPSSGNIMFEGENVLEYNRKKMKEFRRKCQVIFQDPFESLNPRFPVARLVTEPLKIHGIGSRREREEKTRKALRDAGLKPPEKYLNRLPNELSGGERQRVSIARALVLEPSFLLADEPVSMLDVSVKTGVLQLFEELQEKRDMTILYISHDLSTINYLTDRTMIMYLGNIVEIGPTHKVIHKPTHPYTETLLDAVPSPDPSEKRTGTAIRGEIPDPVNLPQGCRFEPNCEYSTKECKKREPNLEPVSYFVDGMDKEQSPTDQEVACYHPVNQEIQYNKRSS